MSLYKVALYPGAGIELQTTVVDACTAADAIALASITIGNTVPLSEADEVENDARYIYMDRTEFGAENCYLLIEGAVCEEMTEEDEKAFRKEEMKRIVEETIFSEFNVKKDKDGSFSIEMYADYRDTFPKETVFEILRREDADYMDLFRGKIGLWYGDETYECMKRLKDAVNSEIEESALLHNLTAEEAEFLEDYLAEHVHFDLPYDHYLRQKFNVAITVDTGDGNYDFTLNHTFPAYGADRNEPVHEKAGILWLTEQQGYTKDELLAVLRGGKTESKFLRSVHQEILNISTHMNAVTFLVRLTVEEILRIATLMKGQTPNEKPIYDASKRPDCGSITLSKRTFCGLFDPWNGAGSLFEIELEKDIELPIRFIRDASPDSNSGLLNECGVDEVYGFVGSAWTHGELLSIEEPQEI